jgi:hypothetical protein
LKRERLEKKSQDRLAKEEMNLAEYPITLLSTTAPKGVKTIEHIDWLTVGGRAKPVRWLVTGSDKYGLHVGGDQDIYVAVMETWREDGFKSKVIPIGSIYKMLKKMGLSDSQRNYDRVKQALNRLTTMSIVAENAFWDKDGRRYIETQAFHLFDEYKLAEERGKVSKKLPLLFEGESHDLPPGYIIVSEALFRSVKKGYLKDTDLTFYFSLSSALPRRIYRFLDKKKYGNATFTMELFKFATKIGMKTANAQKYYPSNVKQKLNPAFEELKEKQFLQSYGYQKTSDSLNEKIVFAFAKQSEISPSTCDDHQDYWIKPFVEDIITITGDEHSVAWYTRTLRILGQDRSRALIYYALSLTKEAISLEEIKTTKDQYFISTLMRLCRESGVNISSQPS